MAFCKFFLGQMAFSKLKLCVLYQIPLSEKGGGGREIKDLKSAILKSKWLWRFAWRKTSHQQSAPIILSVTINKIPQKMYQLIKKGS